MRAILVALCLVSLVIVCAPVDARGPGGGCQIQEEYVTEAHTSGNIRDGSIAVEPGAPRPIECYY